MLHTGERIGGKRAARLAVSVRLADPALAAYAYNADGLYMTAASLLGLYGVAFYGEPGTAPDRRRLRDAWRECRAIAAAN